MFKKEIAKLDTLNPQSPDYSIQIGFLQTMVDLPWNYYTQDDLSLTRAKSILNHDHYGMEKVKGAHPGIPGRKSAATATGRVLSSASTVLQALARPVWARASPRP